jgi:hypothetical protein
MSRPRTAGQPATKIDRAAAERAMRQLNLCTRLLATVLVALGARIVISGPTPVTAFSASVLAVLLLAALLLNRYGRRHQPRATPGSPRRRRQRPPGRGRAPG